MTLGGFRGAIQEEPLAQSVAKTLTNLWSTVFSPLPVLNGQRVTQGTRRRSAIVSQTLTYVI